MFALSITCLLISGACLFTFLMQRASIDTSFTVETEIAAGEKVFDEYTPVELSLTWNDYQKFNFGPKMLPPFFVMAKIAAKLERWSIISGILFLLSGLAAATIWFSTRKRSRSSGA